MDHRNQNQIHPTTMLYTLKYQVSLKFNR